MTERYRGMNAAGTGTLTDEDHVWQSVNDILLTPVGSRLMRRNYGSLCPDLIDSPKNDVTRLQLMSAAVIALASWEPRIVLDTIKGNGCRLAMETFPCHHLKFKPEQIAPSVIEAEKVLAEARKALEVE